MFPTRRPRRSSSRSTTRTRATNTPGSTRRRVVDRLSTGSNCRATAWATTSARTPHEPPTPAEAQSCSAPVARRQAAHGLLPDQPLQAAGEQRPGVPAVGRAAHPAQLRLPARDRERTARCPSGRRTPSCWTLALTMRTLTESMRYKACSTRMRSEDSPQFTEPEDLGHIQTESSELVPRKSTRTYAGPYQRRFSWLRPGLFVEALEQDVLADIQALLGILANTGEWDPDKDAKLKALQNLLTKDSPEPEGPALHAVRRHRALPGKRAQASRRRTGRLRYAVDSSDPTALAWRFSPEQRETGSDRPDKGAAGPGRHRRSQRRPKPPGCVDRRELRPALGDHPLDPAGRPRGPHRAEGGGDPLLSLLAGRRRRADHPAPGTGPATAAGERRGRRHR